VIARCRGGGKIVKSRKLGWVLGRFHAVGDDRIVAGHPGKIAPAGDDDLQRLNADPDSSPADPGNIPDHEPGASQRIWNPNDRRIDGKRLPLLGGIQSRRTLLLQSSIENGQAGLLCRSPGIGNQKLLHEEIRPAESH